MELQSILGQAQRSGPDGRSSELSLASHGKRLVFASFLTDTEREDFALALSSVLSAEKSPDAV